MCDGDIEYVCSICGTPSSVIQKRSGVSYKTTIFVRPCTRCTPDLPEVKKYAYQDGYHDGRSGFESLHPAAWRTYDDDEEEL